MPNMGTITIRDAVFYEPLDLRQFHGCAIEIVGCTFFGTISGIVYLPYAAPPDELDTELECLSDDDTILED